MIRKALSVFNVSVFIVLISINLWIYINRNNGFAYTNYATTNQLYIVDENPRITQFNLTPENQLAVTIKKGSKEEQPIIVLKSRKHYYKTMAFNDTIFLTIDYTKAIDYAQSDRDRSDVVEIRDCSIPLFSGKLTVIDDWQQQSVFETEAETELVKKIGQDSLHILGTDSTVIKIQKIASYILKRTTHSLGIPTDSMNTLSPYNQLECVKQKKSKLWCGNLTDIFSFYSKSLGLTTRLVCLEGNWNNSVYRAGHSFNEVYLPEYKQWAFVDLTSKTILVQSIDNHYLNSIEFYNLYHLAPQSIVATTVYNDTIKKMTIDLARNFYNDYFTYNNRLVFYKNDYFSEAHFSIFKKIKRYWSKQSAFCVYADAQETKNTRFYLKQSVTVLLVLFCVYWLVSSFLLKLQKQKS